MIRTILWWVFSTIVAVIIFIVALILVPIKTTLVVPTAEMSYIFVDENGNEYNVFEKTHGAATDWSFLFENSDDSEALIVDTWVENVELSGEVLLSWSDIETTWNEAIHTWTNLLVSWAETQKNTWLQHIDYVWSWNVDEINSLQTWTNKNDNQPTVVYKNCVTPWNTIVAHWDYVLAYQQRSDVANVCNVQKRVCNNWVLKWSYTQWYCNESADYTYSKQKVVAYNNSDPQQLVQNPKYAKNDGAEFDTHGKLVWEWNSPKTIWDNNENNPVELWKKWELENNEYYNCETPWWEIITHGQFTKAYESPLWFKDQPCKVELRLCMDWKLQWVYSYSKCEYIDKTYYDYLDETKTVQELFDEATQLYSGFEYDDVEWEIINLYEDSTDLLESHSSEWESTYIKNSFVKEVWDWLISLFVWK